MLRFFRHIRKSLMEQNKTRTYLLYAIGEIALVMIGILLALQVNNWNENRYKLAQEQVILEEIVSDLSESKRTLSELVLGDTSSVRSVIISIKILTDHIESKEPYNDSLADHFTKLFDYDNVVYKTSGYETLKSYGFDYISEPEIRKEIGIYYTTVVPQTRFQFEEVRDDFYSYMIDYLRKDFITTFTDNSERGALFLPSDYDSLVENGEFLQSIKVYRDIQELYIKNLEHSLNETQELLSLITDYLDA